MKLINEKGKLFGLINIVDLIVVLFILLVIGGVVWTLFGQQISEAAEAARLAAARENRIPVTFTVRIASTDRVYYDQTVNIGFPQQLCTTEGMVDDAWMVGMEIEPSYVVTTNSSGVTQRVLQDSRFDIICIIEAMVDPGEFIVVGSQEIRIGMPHFVKTQFFGWSGYIQTMEIDIGKFAPSLAK